MQHSVVGVTIELLQAQLGNEPIPPVVPERKRIVVLFFRSCGPGDDTEDDDDAR